MSWGRRRGGGGRDAAVGLGSSATAARQAGPQCVLPQQGTLWGQAHSPPEGPTAHGHPADQTGKVPENPRMRTKT